MTQQGFRQLRWRQGAGTTFTYNGDLISAGELASGLSGLTFNDAEQFICRAISGRQNESLPNLQAAAAQTLDVPGGWDSVGLELPIIGWDFTSGGSFPDLDYGAAVAGARGRDSWRFVSSGEARSGPAGLLVEKQSTNKCTNTNFNPTDLTGVTPDGNWSTFEVVTVESLPDDVRNGLPEADPEITHVYHGISTAASASSISGLTGNTNGHTSSAFMYVVSGTGAVGLTNSTATTSTAASWNRVEQVNETPLSAAMLLNIGTTEASEIFWYGNVMEERPFRSSPIKTAGSAVTRLRDAASVQTSTFGFDPDNFIVRLKFTKYGTPSALFDRVISLDNNVSTMGTFITLFVTPGANLTLGDGNGNDIATGVINLEQEYTVAFGANGTEYAIAVDGVYAGASAYTVQPDYPSLRFGHQLGAGAELDGYLSSVTVFDATWSQPLLEQLST